MERDHVIFFTGADARYFDLLVDLLDSIVDASLSAIPKSLSDPVDDPFRSLGELIRAGGCAKSNAPFFEFLWADFLRRRIKRHLVEDDSGSALVSALEACEGLKSATMTSAMGSRRWRRRKARRPTTARIAATPGPRGVPHLLEPNRDGGEGVAVTDDWDAELHHG